MGLPRLNTPHLSLSQPVLNVIASIAREPWIDRMNPSELDVETKEDSSHIPHFWGEAPPTAVDYYISVSRPKLDASSFVMTLQRVAIAAIL